MKSTLVNMTAVLFVITLVASAGVGVVNMITEEPIEVANKNTAAQLVKEVLPEGVEIAPADTLLNVKGSVVAVSVGTLDGEVAGYAVSAPSLTRDGFNGKISLMVGFTPDGHIYNIRVLQQNETPGLGTNMAVEGNKLYASFFDKQTGEGKDPARMKLAVTKDGGEVDALTAATISSRAYVNAVTTAYAAYLKKSGQSSEELDRIAGDADNAATTDEAAAIQAAETENPAMSNNNEPAAQEGGEK